MDKAIRVLTFSGKKKDWPMWEAKYAARARAKGWYQVLVGATEVPAAATVLTDQQVTLQAARKANEDGYADLLLSMEDEVTFNIVNEAKTTDLPDGSLPKAWKDLKARFAPSTKSELVDLRREFMTLTIETGDDPEEFLTNLEAINRKIRNIDATRAMNDDDVLIQAMATLPSEYDHLIPGWTERIGATQDPLTMEQLKTELRTVYKRQLKRGNDDEPKALAAIDEMAAAAMETSPNRGTHYGDRRSGVRVCYNCGEPGHIALNCKKPKKNNNNNQRGNFARRESSLICGYCGKRGHTESRCWKKRDTELAQKGARLNKLREAKALLAAICDEEAALERELEEQEYEGEKEAGAVLLALEALELQDDDEDDVSLPELETRVEESDSDSECEDEDEMSFSDTEDHLESQTVELETEEAILVRPKRPTKPTIGTCMDMWDRRIRDQEQATYDEQLSVYMENLARYQVLRRDPEEPAVYNPSDYPAVTHKGRIPMWPETSYPISETQKQVYNDAFNAFHKWNEQDEFYIQKLRRSAEKALPVMEKALFSGARQTTDKITKNTWLADSGATSHMTSSSEGLFNIKPVKKAIKIGDKTSLWATMRGDCNMIAVQQDGTEQRFVLQDILVVPELGYNLFSLTKAWRDHKFKIIGDEYGLRVRKGDFELKFDKCIGTGGMIVGVDLLRDVPTGTGKALILREGSTLEYKVLHSYLGHIGEQQVRDTAKMLGLILTGKPGKCQHCAISKARQKNITKTVQHEKGSDKPGQRLFFDISSVRERSLGGSKFWLLVVDDATDMSWSMFLKQKSELSKHMITFVKSLEAQGHKVEYLRCDNAGENLKFQSQATVNGITAKFEITAPGTPQQNGKCERKFATLYGRVRAMLRDAILTQDMKNKLWTECAATATKLDSVTVNTAKLHKKGDGMKNCPYYKFYGQLPSWIRNLKQFGEIAIITDHAKKKVQGKLMDRGFPAMFIGYPDNHPCDTYKFLNLRTNKTILSRDAVWLNKTWGKWKNINIESNEDTDSDDDGSVHSEGNNAPILPNDNDANSTSDGSSTDHTEHQSKADDESSTPESRLFKAPRAERGTKLYRALRNLDTEFNPTTRQYEEDDETNEEEIGMAELALVSIMSGARDPLTFAEAWFHPDPHERKMWREAISKEFRDMKRRNVWKLILRKNVPKDRRLIGCKWVFKKKKNGVYRARLVALGYSQIPGVDYTENFAPVVDDVTFRLVLIWAWLCGLEGEVIDIETAFLYGDLEQEIYMTVPEGLQYFEEVTDDMCARLLATIYGLVQAARQFWKKLTKTLVDKMGFERSLADPCLLVKHHQKYGPIAFCTYVDDGALFGTPEGKSWFKGELRKYFSTKEANELTEYVGVDIIPTDKGYLLRQDDLIARLEKDFSQSCKDLKSCESPMKPNYTVMRPTEEDDLISSIDQKKYRSGVGSLNYLVKHTRPDLSNAVRELSKVLDGATEQHMRDMYRAIKYVLDTRKYGLPIEPTHIPVEPTHNWIIDVWCDSDWAGDKDTRRSVSGCEIYVNGVLVHKKSRLQKTVSLSSCEAEYIAFGEAGSEALYIRNVVESMGVTIQYPIKMYMDNQGAIFLAYNESTARTKHIDVRHHFMRELTEGPNPIMEVIYVPSNLNKADVYTKNVPVHIFKKAFLEERLREA